jgi:hypothetical protein
VLDSSIISRRRAWRAAMSTRTIAGLTLLMSACTEPMFHDDILDGGGIVEAGSSGPCRGVGCGINTDAVIGPSKYPAPPTPDTQLPKWASGMLGTYALRVRYYGHVGNLEHATQIVARAKIEERANKDVIMTMTLCEYAVETRDPAAADAAQSMWTLRPEREPAEVYPLKFSREPDKVWDTAKEQATLVGYTSTVSRCASGLQLDRQPEQAWLGSGKCKCPVDGTIPVSADDCRVNDPDRDQLPGMAMQMMGQINGIDHVVREDSSQFVLGERDPDTKRLTAEFFPKEKLRRLECVGRACEGSQTDPAFCYSANNPAVFERLADESEDAEPYDCAAILREVKAGKLLVEERPPAFPSNCTVQQATAQVRAR